ncbi:amidohydrolase [Saccharopolyspora sp. ID03-671]|uniref:amidohydrolase n=1 Tax=Saccharopolyspora sp. ID03-671 TaxID=3073066 RepID=UPI00325545B2
MPADLVVTGGRIWTQDPARPWAEALAVREGKIVAIGSGADVEAFTGPRTQVHDAAGAMLMPGLIDGHVHLGLGGSQAAFELPLDATDDLDAILGKVAEWAADLEPDAWVVGGIVGSTVLDGLTTAALARLDRAAGGRPVLLRDDTMHNRWVSSRALELMGVGPGTADPDGGRYVRDTGGDLTGVLHESASGEAESAFTRSIPDVQARTDASVAVAVDTLNAYGVTSAQEAATMLGVARSLAALEASGGLNARVVLSMPVRPFIEDGAVGEELVAEVAELAGDLVRPDFVKIFLDGVPTTRTSALLTPYRCAHGTERGEMYWELDDLVAQLRRCAQLGLGAKVHATGDASARRVLDAAERVREDSDLRLQLAHAEFIHADDVPRFAALDVVADVSPYIWYPGVIQDSIAEHVPQEIVESSWPMRDLLDGGAIVAAGSDWPCAVPTPDPWTGLEAMVTRRNPDERFPGTLNPAQKLTVAEAITAFTSHPAVALGLGDTAGKLATGYSADFIELDRNLFEIDPTDIHATRVRRTYFAGRLVHENPDV